MQRPQRDLQVLVEMDLSVCEADSPILWSRCSGASSVQWKRKDPPDDGGSSENWTISHAILPSSRSSSSESRFERPTRGRRFVSCVQKIIRCHCDSYNNVEGGHAAPSAPSIGTVNTVKDNIWLGVKKSDWLRGSWRNEWLLSLLEKFWLPPLDVE